MRLDQPTHECLRVATQGSGAQIAFGLVLLAPGRSPGDRDEHDDRPQPADPRRPAPWRNAGGDRQRDAEEDEATIHQLRASNVAGIQVIEVRDLVREDRRGLLGVEQLEQTVPHRDRRLADRRQREGVDEARSLGSHAIDLRCNRARSSHDLVEARDQLCARQALGGMGAKPDSRIPRLPCEQPCCDDRRDDDGRRPTIRSSRRGNAADNGGCKRERDPEPEAASDRRGRVPEVGAKPPRLSPQPCAERVTDGDQQEGE